MHGYESKKVGNLTSFSRVTAACGQLRMRMYTHVNGYMY